MSASSADRPSLDVDRPVSVLARHEVEHLLIGGVATRLYGARRRTEDFDCLVCQTRASLARLRAAMKEPGGYLRVAGLRDADAAALPVQCDPETILRLQIPTRTVSGDFDVLVDIPSSDDARRRYEDLVASKRAAGGEKDLDALPELDEILAFHRRRNASDDEPGCMEGRILRHCCGPP